MEERIIKDINNLLTQLFQKMKEAGYEWDAEKKELKKIEQSSIDVRTTGYWHVEDVEQKQDWSEEDERNLQGIIDEIEKKKNQAPGYDIATYGRFLSWLKSLKERIGNFDDGYKVGFSAAKYNQWKPSDEQMYILNWVADILLNHDSVVEIEASKKLQSLYNDLKKLK